METLSAVLEAWEPFYTAQLGAAATLGGLVFVGLSLNLTKILAYPALLNRALLALNLLLAALIMASLMLMPGLSWVAIGTCTLVLGLAIWAAGTAIDLRSFRTSARQSRARFIFNTVLFECATVPYVIAGVMFLLGDTRAMYWIATAIIISFVKAVMDAWVLLVEINR